MYLTPTENRGDVEKLCAGLFLSVGLCKSTARANWTTNCSLMLAFYLFLIGWLALKNLLTSSFETFRNV